MDVAVIGAGIAGLACARALREQGLNAFVFDKARGAGGRMSTRRADALRFDHGAQYFTARDPHFQRVVAGWRQAGVVEPWLGRIHVLAGGAAEPEDGDTLRFVGIPGMNAVCKHMAAGLEVRYATRIAHLERTRAHWHLTDEEGADLGPFDAVVVSAPAPQTAELLARAAPALSAQAAAAPMAPCWAVMAAFAAPLDVGFDGAFVHDSPLSWVANNGSKPGRPAGEAWVLHAGADWSGENLERDREDVAVTLLAALEDALGERLPPTHHVAAHRWAYALPTGPLPDRALFEADLALAACGDWCAGPRVEGAYVSGRAAAARILAIPAGGSR